MSFIDRYYAPLRKLFNLPLVKFVPLVLGITLGAGALGYSAVATAWPVLLLTPLLLLLMFSAVVMVAAALLSNAPVWQNQNAITGFCTLQLGMLTLFSICIGMSAALNQPLQPMLTIGGVLFLLLLLLSRVRITQAAA